MACVRIPVCPPRKTGRSAVRRSGFTLIELLVVLLLIGIITSFAVLSIRTDPWEGIIHRELERLTALVAAGSEHAVLRSEELAMLFADDGYSFLTRGDKDWEPYQGDRLFRERSLPEGVTLKLEIEDRDLRLDDEDETKPMVLLLSSGEVTPFSIRLIVDETGFTRQRSWDTFGAVETDEDKKDR